jgi:hypothetical protein
MSYTVEEDTSTNVVEDFLSVDQPVPGQNFCCLSFVSPEKVLRRKHLFMMKAFLHDLFDKKEVDAKYNDDEREVLKKIRQDKFDHLFDSDFDYQVIDDLFENFRVTNEDPVFKKFDAENDFQTSVRGLKVRGTYDTRREAEVRAEVLRRKDPNFNVFVGQVGYWLPWDPEPHQINEQVDQEQQLNELVKRYQENKERVDEEFQRRKDESLKAAREENERKKKEQAEAARLAAERGEVEKEVVTLGDQEEQVQLVEDPTVLDLRDEDDLPELEAPVAAEGEPVAEASGDQAGAGAGTDGRDTEEVAQRKLAELRETLKHKDSGYASLMGKPDPWLSRKREQEEAEKAEKEQVLSPEETAKELDNIAANIF